MNHTIPYFNEKPAFTNCARLPICYYNWNSKIRPQAYGQLAFQKDTGFLVRLTCQEADPLRRITENNGPVYRDSALEFFFQFRRKDGYFNFECNANGSMLAMFGESRTSRTAFSRDQLERLQVKSRILPTKWSVEFRIPLDVLGTFLDVPKLDLGSTLYFNLYKISESADIEHYGSFAPISWPEPNFHLTEYFAPATLVSGS